MKKAFLVFRCDTWHTEESKRIIAVASCQENAVGFCKDQAKKDGEEISEDDLYLLNKVFQTQGYEGEGEFIIEEVLTDCLL